MKLKNFMATAMLVAALAASADVPLEIYRGEQRGDTVYRPVYYLIGVTSPEASAEIAGKDCHVYRTGSFGAEINLEEGENHVAVEVKKDGEVCSRDVRIVYVKPERAISHVQERTVPLQWPVNLITLKGAYLQYGNGGDRLGGSKMGFLDDGIALTAVGETKSLYKVRLGDNGYAYVPKEYVEKGGDGAGTVNSGSASVTATGRSDRLTIALPCRLPYWSRSEIDPSTIVVSLYGVTNNTNWLTRRGKLGMVDYVDIRQDEGGVLNFVLRLKDRYMWGYSVHYEGNNLIVDVRHRPESLSLKDLTIGLDAGHGGPYPGAISPSGLTEKDVNLDIVLNIAEILRSKGAKVVLTRDGDSGPSMAERKQTWLDGDVDIAVSVHNNSSGNPLKPMGTSAYYKHISNMPFAESLHNAMLGLGLSDFGLTGNFNFSLNAPTEYPNALVEVLFMSSLPEEELLADAAYRRRIAEAIVKGLSDYLAKVKESL